MSADSSKLTAAELRAFRRSIDTLNRVLDVVRIRHPDASYYLAMSDLHLMSGPSHDEQDGARQDRILATGTLARAGGGDW